MADTKLRDLERKSATGDRESEVAARRERCRAEKHCDHAPMSRKPIKIPVLPRLWYQNEAGERWIPPDRYDGSEPPPEGYIYQHSRFPRTLQESVLRITQADEVAACSHENVVPTYGWIEGIEGRRCVTCQGTQTHDIGSLWSEEWDSGGSRQVITGNMGWPADIATELVKHGTHITDAILFCAVACERCMNITSWNLGLPDGYAGDSQEAMKAGTSCEICQPPKEHHAS